MCILQDETQRQSFALAAFLEPRAPPAMSGVLGSLSGEGGAPDDDDDDDLAPPNSEVIAETADNLDDADEDMLIETILNADKLPDPMAIHMESPPPPPKQEPNIITPPSSVGSSHGKVPEYSGPPSFNPPETPPLSNKMTKQECSPIATAKSPPTSNTSLSKTSTNGLNKSPRRGRPPKIKTNSASGQSEKFAADTPNKKSVSRQNSSKSKHISTEKKATTPKGKRGRPPKPKVQKLTKSPKSKKFVSSSDDSMSSACESSSSDDDDGIFKMKNVGKSSPVKSERKESSSKRTGGSPAATVRKRAAASGGGDADRRAASPPAPLPASTTTDDTDVDLEAVMNEDYSPAPKLQSLLSPTVVLSPLPSEADVVARTAQSKPLVNSSGKMEGSGPRAEGSSDAMKTDSGVSYVNGKPRVMVKIDLSKLPSVSFERTRSTSGSDMEVVEQKVSALIQDGKSLLGESGVTSLVQPLPPSPMYQRVPYSDSISTNSEFEEDVTDSSDDEKDKSDSKPRTSDGNNNDSRRKQGERDRSNHDTDTDSSSGSSSGSSSSSDSSSEDEEEGKSKSVSESAGSEAKQTSQERTGAGEESTAKAQSTSSKVTASEQKQVLNEIFNRNGGSNLSGVKIPKKRALSPSGEPDDRKKVKTDRGAKSTHQE